MIVDDNATCPFTLEEIRAGKKFLAKWCKEKGHPPVQGPDDAEQKCDIRLLQAFLATCGDPDAPALDAFARGSSL